MEKFSTYITCSPMDSLQWMGAVRMRVQTADKNITIIHTTPVHQLRNKSIIMVSLTSNCCKQSKCESSIDSIALSSGKSHLNQEGNMHRSSTDYKLKKFWKNMWVDFDVRGQQRMVFYLKKCYYGLVFYIYILYIYLVI